MFLAFFLVAACAVTGPPDAAVPVPAPDPRAVAAPITLFVVRRHWHIDVGFSVQDLTPPLAATAADFPHSRYVFFGFGDRRYLLSKTHGAPVLLAALWPGPALVLVTTIETAPRQAFGGDQVVELSMAAQQAQAVQGFIWGSLSKNAEGAVSTYAPGPYAGSAYFAALPEYSGLHTCITWAAEALRAGGFPVRSRLTVVAGQLWRQVLELQRAATSALRGGGSREAVSTTVSIAGRRVAVLADHGGAAALGNHDSGPGRGRRAAAADAAGE
jgi:hypothetical protein